MSTSSNWTKARPRTHQVSARCDLIDVADSITSELVVGQRHGEGTGQYIIGALTLIKWRDGIVAALKFLETR